MIHDQRPLPVYFSQVKIKFPSNFVDVWQKMSPVFLIGYENNEEKYISFPNKYPCQTLQYFKTIFQRDWKL